MKRDPVILVVVALLATLMLVFGLRMARHGGGRATTARITQAPDFALQSVDGKTVHLSDFRGKAVLLNFWATWCGPCKIEMPWFVDLQRKYGAEGLQIVGISVDDDSTPDEVSKFAKDMGVNYPILMGKEAVENAYGGVQFLPISFFIDRDGKVIDKAYGLKGRGEIEDSIKKALAQGAVAQAGN